jgi:hypothetical protein
MPTPPGRGPERISAPRGCLLSSAFEKGVFVYEQAFFVRCELVRGTSSEVLGSGRASFQFALGSASGLVQQMPPCEP